MDEFAVQGEVVAREPIALLRNGPTASNDLATLARFVGRSWLLSNTADAHNGPADGKTNAPAKQQFAPNLLHHLAPEPACSRIQFSLWPGIPKSSPCQEPGDCAFRLFDIKTFLKSISSLEMNQRTFCEILFGWTECRVSGEWEHVCAWGICNYKI